MSQEFMQGSFSYIFIFGMLFIMYFFMIRPQKKRQKQQEALLRSLVKGDEIMTNSGIYAVVDQLKDNDVILEIAPGVKIRILRSCIIGKFPSQTAETETEPTSDIAES